MTVGPTTETRGHTVGFREEINKAAMDDDGFFTWFNGGETASDAFDRGLHDFAEYIWRPLSPHVTNPATKTILEIGHGGGRLLAAAQQRFRCAYGVDIHDQNDKVRAELQRRGATGCQLFQVTKPTIPLKDYAVDVVYSFIVLQHVEKMETFQRYLAETHRVLAPGGVALLYFGRKTFFSGGTKSHWKCSLDAWLEPLLMPTYQEVPARVNCVNLFISRRYARRRALECGFVVDRMFVSEKVDGQGHKRFGGQIGMILCKRDSEVCASQRARAA